jgi:hypothetical protein
MGKKGTQRKQFHAAQKSMRHWSCVIGVTVAREENHQRPACTNSNRRFGNTKSIVVVTGAPAKPSSL